MAHVREIAFSGKQRSGKTSVANVVSELVHSGEYHPYLTTRTISMAEPLREGVVAVLQAMGIQVEPADLKNPETKSAYRPALQDLGMTLRKYDPFVWARLGAGQALGVAHEVLMLNDDCRFPEEVTALRERGFIVVRLEASRGLRAERGELVNEDHASETGLDDYTGWDMVINQDVNLKSPLGYAIEVLDYIQDLEIYERVEL